jgi:hypothetical protein
MLCEQSDALSLRANKIRLTRICSRNASSYQCSFLSLAWVKTLARQACCARTQWLLRISSQGQNGIRSRVAGSIEPQPPTQDTSGNVWKAIFPSSNSGIHYHVHKSLALSPNMSQLNSICFFTFHLCRPSFNIILLSTSFNPMEQNPFWGADSWSASQEIPCLLQIRFPNTYARLPKLSLHFSSYN